MRTPATFLSKYTGVKMSISIRDWVNWGMATMIILSWSSALRLSLRDHHNEKCRIQRFKDGTYHYQLMEQCSGLLKCLLLDQVEKASKATKRDQRWLLALSFLLNRAFSFSRLATFTAMDSMLVTRNSYQRILLRPNSIPWKFPVFPKNSDPKESGLMETLPSPISVMKVYVRRMACIVAIPVTTSSFTTLGQLYT